MLIGYKYTDYSGYIGILIDYNFDVLMFSFRWSITNLLESNLCYYNIINTRAHGCLYRECD